MQKTSNHIDANDEDTEFRNFTKGNETSTFPDLTYLK